MEKDNQESTKDEIAEAMRLPREQIMEALGAIGWRKAQVAIDYYERGIPPKRGPARALRMSALALGVLASLAPLLITLVATFFFPGRPSLVKDLVSVSAIFAGLAVACVGIDRLFGYSSGWMRFIGVMLELQSRQRAFAFAWMDERLRASAKPSEDQLLASGKVLAAFIAGVDEVVRSETQTWANEFRGALADLDKAAEAQRAQLAALAPPERGAIEVRVSGATTVDEEAFTVQLRDGELIARKGATTVAFTQQPPGVSRLVVKAKRAGRDVVVERAVTIESGKVTAIDIPLG